MKSIHIGSLFLAVRLFAATQVQCLDSSSPDLPAIANVFTGYALSNDGQPFYVDQEDNAKVRIFQSGDLWAFNPTDKHATPIRSLKFVLGTRGIIVDHLGEFHALYKLDPPNPVTGLRQIHSIQEIPEGTTVDAGRVEMKAHIDGDPHLILFGSGWPRGVCVTGSAVITPDGTTTATITRFPGNLYEVTVPAPYYGRLYNNKNSNKPADLGLISFPFFVRLTPK
jgi:hypothetical protein